MFIDGVRVSFTLASSPSWLTPVEYSSQVTFEGMAMPIPEVTMARVFVKFTVLPSPSTT